MKKESFDILANFFKDAIACDNPSVGTMPVKSIIDYLTRITVVESINEKIGKLNVWDFVESDKTLTHSMVYYKDGFLSATNRRMLLHIKREYSPELEGRCVKKDGTVVSRCMMGVKETISSVDAIHKESGKKIKIDFDKFEKVSKECKAYRKMSRNTIRPIVSMKGGAVHFYYDELVPAIQFMKDMGIDEMSIVPNKSTSCMIVKDDNVCLLMPVMGDFRQMSSVFEM